MLGSVAQKPTYWQAESESARPSAAVLWVGRRRVSVRLILGAWGLVVIILLALSLATDSSVVSTLVAASNGLVWLTQVILWGWGFPPGRRVVATSPNRRQRLNYLHTGRRSGASRSAAT